MSVYSGFATRKQEAFYNKLLAKMFQLLSQKIISQIPYQDIGKYLQEPSPDKTHLFADQENSSFEQKKINSQQRINTENDDKRAPSPFFMRFDESKWARNILKVFKHIVIMEKSKYLEPHFSKFVAPIVKYSVQRHNLGSSIFAGSNINGVSQINDNHSAMMQMDIVKEQDLESTKKFQNVNTKKQALDESNLSLINDEKKIRNEKKMIDIGNIKSSRSEQKRKIEFYSTVLHNDQLEIPNNNQDILYTNLVQSNTITTNTNSQNLTNTLIHQEPQVRPLTSGVWITNQFSPRLIQPKVIFRQFQDYQSQENDGQSKSQLKKSQRMSTKSINNNSQSQNAKRIIKSRSTQRGSKRQQSVALRQQNDILASKKIDKLIFNPQSSIMSISTNPLRKRKFMRKSPHRPQNVYVNEHTQANQSQMRDMIRIMLRTNEASQNSQYYESNPSHRSFFTQQHNNNYNNSNNNEQFYGSLIDINNQSDLLKQNIGNNNTRFKQQQLQYDFQQQI